MTKIFDETALNILPLPNGFIIAYKKPEEAGEDKMVVAYNLYSFEKESVSSVTRSVYQLAKFGQPYKEITEQLVNPFYWNTLPLQGEKLFAYYPDGNAHIFDAAGQKQWTGKIAYKSSGPAEIVSQGNKLWISFPEEDCIARFNILTMRDEIRIGGKSSAFSHPEGMLLDGDKLYVCNGANGIIWEVDTNNYAVYEYLSLGEPVHQIIKVDGFILVRLDSGVYKL